MVNETDDEDAEVDEACGDSTAGAEGCKGGSGENTDREAR
jgi:hypothetical protein